MTRFSVHLAGVQVGEVELAIRGATTRRITGRFYPTAAFARYEELIAASMNGLRQERECLAFCLRDAQGRRVGGVRELQDKSTPSDPDMRTITAMLDWPLPT